MIVRMLFESHLKILKNGMSDVKLSKVFKGGVDAG